MNRLSFTQWQGGLDWDAQIAGETDRTEAGQISYAVLLRERRRTYAVLLMDRWNSFSASAVNFTKLSMGILC